ncbi:penicillin acylase family protein [Gemmata sp. G18]|uniref:Penicillin acylase family protein n=1 Tax=Gemmata palustris TaxID=2822762 RepID=A0ABS5BW42_9BACT|nr:penicillin acylase family protein [Gemmata palustris]MBP3957893.1 penicillin acylase family protein [Gemmata palustris]
MSFSRLLLRLALGRRLPVTSGELRVRGVSAPVTIRRDKWGVPHIDAETDTDAHFALGFCQGQDRAGQLEVMLRLVRGTMAEWVGAVALPADRMSRHIGFRRAAEAQLKALTPDARAAFEAFAGGVNAGATAGLPQKPHEFAIVGGTPSAWDAADVLGLLKLQSFLLPSNWDVELARLRILLADGPDAMRALDPTALGEEKKGPAEPTATGAGSLAPVFDKLAADLSALQTYLPRGGGSNNWAISGARTASGKPLLASDPHLAPTCPAPWYLAHVRTPQWEAAGATLAGTPGFAIGHNGFAAWGVTAGLTDNSDLFLETLGPDGRSVRQADGTFVACDVVKDVIRVKGAADVVEDVLVTPRGPILTPIIPGVKLALSLAATWLEPRPLIGFLHAPTARSFDEFRRPFAAWPALPLNLLYADAEGAIGWQLVGEIPTRRGGNGLLPQPADVPDSGWTGTVPFDDMPFRVNPECGYLATANDPPTWGEDQRQPTPLAPLPEGKGEKELLANVVSGTAGSRTCSPFPSGRGAGGGGSADQLGHDFIDPYRAQRIRELLAARDTGWTLAECAAIQLDVKSLPWVEVKEAVLALTPTDEYARDGLNLLREWDGQVDTESPAAAVFELFVAEMCVRVAKAKAPNSWDVALGEGALGILPYNLFSDRRVSHLTRLLREQPSGWFASWAKEMEAVLAGVVRRLRREAGPSAKFWAWGHLRRLLLEHPLFGKHRWLGPAFNRGPFPWGGDGNTVSQAGARPAEPTAFTHNMANLRTAFDLADLPKSTFVLCGGQSGNPLSPHHADQLSLWLQGESFTLAWEQADVIRAAVDTLRLLPQ